MPRNRNEASIPLAEQEARRALKLERKALERAVSGGTVRCTRFTDLSTRMGVMRRIQKSGRAVDSAYRDTAARIGAIHRILTEPRA